MLWAYAAVIGLLIAIPLLTVDRKLIKDRLREKRGGADPVRLRFIRLTVVAHFIASFLDMRYHWSDTVPAPLRIAGLSLLALSGWFTYWAMAHNRFFMPVIRIQNDRADSGHQVESGGPYAVVRHPGYAGMVFLAPSSALALGSWLGFAIALLPAALFVARTAHEDRFLHENLAGYREYAARTRWRLVPGLW